MLKKLMLTTALTGALMGTAFAQTVTPAPATTSATASGATLVQTQKPDQWLASKFKGTDVIGADDAKIGDVTDLLFDKNGKIEAYVVGVGGFLGIGAKDVAFAPTAFQVVPADKDHGYDRLRLSMTKDQLKQAANFEPYNPPSMRATTTGTGTPAGGVLIAPRAPPTDTPSTSR